MDRATERAREIEAAIADIRAAEARGLTRETLAGMAQKARALARPHAAARVADEIENLVAKKR